MKLLCVCVSVSFLNNRCRKNYNKTYKFRNMLCNFQIAFFNLCNITLRWGLSAVLQGWTDDLYLKKREAEPQNCWNKFNSFFPLTTKLQFCHHDEQEYEILVSAWIMGSYSPILFHSSVFVRHWLLICAFRWWGMVSNWRRPTTLATAGPTGQVEGHIHCDPGSVGQLWLGHSLPAAIQWLWTNLETV